MPNMYHPFDQRLNHRALGAAALTAAATLATVEQRAAMRTAYLTRFILETPKVSVGNELYTFVIEVSNDAFVTTEVAEILSLGHSSVRIGGAPSNVGGDTYERMWTTEVNGVAYKDWRIRLITAGTSPSITLGCYSSIIPGV